mgnify:CR=1 FL=1
MFIELYCKKAFEDLLGHFVVGDIYSGNLDIRDESMFKFHLNWILRHVNNGDFKIVAPWKYTKAHINQDLINNRYVVPLIEYCEAFYNKWNVPFRV